MGRKGAISERPVAVADLDEQPVPAFLEFEVLGDFLVLGDGAVLVVDQRAPVPDLAAVVVTDDDLGVHGAGRLDEDDRKLILEYFEKDKREKIELRRRIAEERGITLNTLRMRVHRINADLEKCIVACLNDTQAK